MLYSFLNKVIEFPKIVLSFILILTMVAFWGLTKINVNSKFVADIPQDDPLVISEKKIKSIFGESTFVWIGIKGDNVFQKSTLEKVASISESLKSIKWVIDDEIKSLTTVNNIKGVAEGIEVGPYLSEIPNSTAAFAQLAEDIKKDNLLNGHLVSADGTFTVIAAKLEENFNEEAVYQELLSIKSTYEMPESIYLAADLVQYKEIDKGVNSDLTRLIPIALLLILIGYYLTFRSWRGVWLPFSVVVLSIIWTMGALGHIGFSLTVVTSSLPLLMIAVSSSYGIHLLHRYYEDIIGRTNKAGIKEACNNIGKAVLMTGITSAFGALTLLVFEVEMIREFGILATIGMLVVLVISLTFMPAVLTLLKREGNPYIQNNIQNNYILTSIANVAIQQRFAILGAALMISMASVWGLTKIKVGDDFAQYFQKDHVVNQTFNAFNNNLNGAKYFEVMVDAGIEDGVKNPDFLKEMEAFQQYAESLDHVGKTASFVDIIKRINQELHESNTDFLRIPASSTAVSQFMLLYSLSGSPGDFSNLVDYEYQRTKIQVMLNSSKQDDHLAVYEQLQQYQPIFLEDNFKLEFGGEAVRRLAYIKYIVEGKILNIIAAIFIVWLFCSLVFRSLKMGIIAILPLVFSTLATFGLMGFCGIRLEMGTALITAIGVGIGVDFAIHFIMRYQEEAKRLGNLHQATYTTMQTAGRAIGFDVLSNVLGFAVLAFSSFVPIQNFGWLVSITMLNVALSTLLLVPAIMLILSSNSAKSIESETSNPIQKRVLQTID